jgi:hypothetical protein
LSFRFHTRTIIRDKREVFLGSQSLREADLDRRRELGLIVTDRSVVLALLHVFEKDWGTISSRDAESETVKKMAKAVVRELPLGPIVESALKGLQAVRPDSRVGPAGFARRLASAVKDAVKEAVLRATRKRTAA